MLSLAFVLVVLLFLSLVNNIRAYQAGDPVGLLLRTQSGTQDALRSQMPLFGVETTTTLKITGTASSDESREKLSVALTFGTGADSKSLPWVDVRDSGRMLTELEVTFVYAEGIIRSISQSASFAPLSDSVGNQKFAVQYKWVEEAGVDLDSCMWGMFVSVLIASLVLLVSACGSMRSVDDDNNDGSKGGYMVADHSGYASDSTYGSYNATASTMGTAGAWSGTAGGVPAASVDGKWQ
jgi:hypothetical protein